MEHWLGRLDDRDKKPSAREDFRLTQLEVNDYTILCPSYKAELGRNEVLMVTSTDEDQCCPLCVLLQRLFVEVTVLLLLYSGQLDRSGPGHQTSPTTTE